MRGLLTVTDDIDGNKPLLDGSATTIELQGTVCRQSKPFCSRHCSTVLWAARLLHVIAGSIKHNLLSLKLHCGYCTTCHS